MEIHSFFISDSPQSQPVPAVRSGVWSKSRHVPGGTGITSPSDSRSGTAETIGVRSVPLLWSSRSVRSVWMGREIASSVGLHRHNTSSPRQKASTGSASVGRCAQRKGLCGHRAGMRQIAPMHLLQIGSGQCIQSGAFPTGQRQIGQVTGRIVVIRAGQQPTCGQAVRAVPGLVQEQISQGLGGLLRLSHAVPQGKRRVQEQTSRRTHLRQLGQKPLCVPFGKKIGGH